jgi:ferric-dicitrate binding protein FerR (iron transport regulator)
MSIEWEYIEKSVNGTLRPDQQRALNEWLDGDPRRRAWWNAIRDERRHRQPDDATIARWRADFAARLHRARARRRRRLVVYRGAGVAAVVAGAILLVARQPAERRLAPVEEWRGISLANAEGIVTRLTATPGTDTMRVDGITVTRDGHALLYPPATPGGAPRENVIRVSRGNEYRLRLGDGTVVWLNAESELRFPASFPPGERRVHLRGEAYFEVEAAADRPFLVNYEGAEVEVLGTRFNVNARAQRTTLVEGRLLVRAPDGTTRELLPGETVATGTVTGGVALLSRDPRRFVAWHEGRYFFIETPVEEILDDLAPWYDVEIIFADHPARAQRFSGIISRHDSFETLMNLLECTRTLSFTVSGRRVTIRSLTP